MLTTSLIFLLVISIGAYFFTKEKCPVGSKYIISLSLVLLVGSVMSACLITVPAGHVKVGALFGKVSPHVYKEGLHAVNPLMKFSPFDVRQKTHKEKAGIPSEDKLITSMDVSVQYRIISDKTPEIFQNTGTPEALIEVHLVPKLRSILREQGKGVQQSQDFFKESVQKRLQITLRDGLSLYLADKGISVDTVLIRDIVLPSVIRTAITETKKREQEVIKQSAELQRYAMEQDQLIKKAESELAAAKVHADKVRTLANAEADRVKTLAEAESFRINTEYTGRAEGVAKLRKQLTPKYISYLHAQQWDGKLPVYSGGENTPMIDLRKD